MFVLPQKDWSILVKTSQENYYLILDIDEETEYFVRKALNRALVYRGRQIIYNIFLETKSIQKMA